MTCGVCLKPLPPPPPLRADYDDVAAWKHEHTMWARDHLRKPGTCWCKRCDTCQGLVNDTLGLALRQDCRCEIALDRR